jgi:hypothetical protein
MRLAANPSRPPAVKEIVLVKELLLTFGNEPDLRLFRNNSGVLTDVTGRPVKFGLATGSADIVGILAPHGLFIAWEVKIHRPGSKESDEQLAWARMIREMGGVCDTVRSVEDARVSLTRARACPR